MVQSLGVSTTEDRYATSMAKHEARPKGCISTWSRLTLLPTVTAFVWLDSKSVLCKQLDNIGVSNFTEMLPSCGYKQTLRFH
jgi:hypothetical protein